MPVHCLAGNNNFEERQDLTAPSVDVSGVRMSLGDVVDSFTSSSNDESPEWQLQVAKSGNNAKI